MKTVSTLLLSLLLVCASVTNKALALPVRLTNFTAVKEGNAVKLQWQTAQEAASREFSIERSTDGITFTAIGTVAAAGTINEKRDYTFTDGATTKSTIYYRLKETGISGQATYSIVRTVDAPAGFSPLLWTLEGAAIQVQLPGADKAGFVVSSMGGRLVQKGTLVNGKTRLDRFPSGIYSITVQSGTGVYSAKMMVR